MSAFDIRFESEEGDCGLRQIIITALTQQAEIDLAMEEPRIKKLLERDWEESQ